MSEAERGRRPAGLEVPCVHTLLVCVRVCVLVSDTNASTATDYRREVTSTFMFTGRRRPILFFFAADADQRWPFNNERPPSNGADAAVFLYASCDVMTAAPLEHSFGLEMLCC